METAPRLVDNASVHFADTNTTRKAPSDEISFDAAGELSFPFKLSEQSRDLLRAIGNLLVPKEALALQARAQEVLYTSEEMHYLALLEQFQVLSSDQKNLTKIYLEGWSLLSSLKITSTQDRLLGRQLVRFLLGIVDYGVWPLEKMNIALEALDTEVVVSIFKEIALIDAHDTFRLMLISLPPASVLKIAKEVFPLCKESTVMVYIENFHTAGLMPFFTAAKNNRMDLIEDWLDVDIDLNQQDLLGRSALMLAAQQGALDVVIKFLACPQLNVNLRDRMGCTALYFACLEGHEAIALLLLAHPQVDPNAYSVLLNEGTLHLALRRNQLPIINAFLAHPKKDLSLQDMGGRSGLEMLREAGFGNLQFLG